MCIDYFIEYFNRLFYPTANPHFSRSGRLSKYSMQILDEILDQAGSQNASCFMHIPAVVTMPIPVCSMLLPLQGWLMEFTSEASLTRVCNTNYVSLLSPIASAPCVPSVLRSLPALAVQTTSNRDRDWGSCDENLSVRDFPTITK